MATLTKKYTITFTLADNSTMSCDVDIPIAGVVTSVNGSTAPTGIYAPTSGGASGYILTGAGTTTKPVWKKPATLTSYKMWLYNNPDVTSYPKIDIRFTLDLDSFSTTDNYYHTKADDIFYELSKKGIVPVVGFMQQYSTSDKNAIQAVSYNYSTKQLQYWRDPMIGTGSAGTNATMSNYDDILGEAKT